MSESQQEKTPIGLGVAVSEDGVVFYAQNMLTGLPEFTVTIQPEDARELAFKLSWNAIRFDERKNPGGGSGTGGP